jgi:flavin reductase (DIM6/NTAB) family NADH-FMN oxidoreductase RutF
MFSTIRGFCKMTIDKDFFRQVMGRFATGITVVTTSSQGAPAGLTVNAFCSVSLNPPLVLVCVDLNSQALLLIRESNAFAVNMLHSKQEYLSRCFATHSRDRFENFCHVSYHTAVTDSPIFDDSLAFIDTRVVAEYPGGDHAIFLGEVVAMGTGERTTYAEKPDERQAPPAHLNGNTPTEPPTPLLYFMAQYRHLAKQYREPSLPTSAHDEEYERKSNS